MFKKKILLSLSLFLLLGACSSANYKIVNDGVTEENRKSTLLKDTGACEQKAYSIIQYNSPVIRNNETPSQKYVFRNRYNQKIGSVTAEKNNQNTSVYDAFKKAQERSNANGGNYEKRIRNYTISCLRAKGWRKVEIEGK